MVKSPPPFKLALAALFLDGAARGEEEVFSALEPEYGACRFFDAAFVRTGLQSLKAVGILKFGERNEEAPASPARYALSSYGREKVRANL
jgi:hypothetical protein